MARYSRWAEMTNPIDGTLTNPLINHNAGLWITQTAQSPTHVLPPASSIGKTFGIANSSESTEPVLLDVATESEVYSFQINPGDMAMFTYIGDGKWDETGGESVIADVAGLAKFYQISDVPSSYEDAGGHYLRVNDAETGIEFVPISFKTALSRQIAYDDPADADGTNYLIGIIRDNAVVDRVVVEIVNAFDDSGVDSLTVTADGGVTDLMLADEVNIKEPGIYVAELPGTGVSTGGISVVFNADPDLIDGTQGSLNVYVQYSLLA